MGGLVPAWWAEFQMRLRGLLEDPVWKENELDEFCVYRFGHGEIEMRNFIDGGEDDPPAIADEKMERAKMTPAQKQAAYRARKKEKR